MALKECAKYQYVVTSTGPKIVPVLDAESKDEESAADYNVGGYLAVKLHDTFKDGRYLVVRKLGWGHFSTVWLVRDNESNVHSALKVVKSAHRYAETARDEIRLLRRVNEASPSHPGRQHLVSFLDSFQHAGPYETHICMIFEPLGENLLALIERNKTKGVARGLVKIIARQVFLGLQYLHEECDLVHTDIKPENIMISIPEVESLILAELSTYRETKPRKVDIPPSKSRGSVTIPRRHRDAHVHIFDSQPLRSPSSLSLSSRSSVSPIRHGLKMTHIRPEQEREAQPAPESGSSGSSGLSRSVNSTGTPATSFGTAPSIAGMKPASCHDDRAGLLPVKANSKSSRIAQVPLRTQKSGPSLLTQTAPVKPPASDSESPSDESLVSPAPSTPSNPPPLLFKIADLGNATPSKSHFTDDIQTRQYRAPEAILGRSDWGCSVDIWSVACVVFELLTAEYLFDPQSQGELFSKDDDHMAQILELLGDFDISLKFGGKYSREIFESSGHLRYIKSLKPWPLKSVMKDKYLYTEADATSLCDFLLPMLDIDYRKRATAASMLNHPWLDSVDKSHQWDD